MWTGPEAFGCSQKTGFSDKNTPSESYWSWLVWCRWFSFPGEISEKQRSLCFRAAVIQSGSGGASFWLEQLFFKKVKVLEITRSDCGNPRASCVQMQLVWFYLDAFDSWIVLQSNFWPQIANSFFSLTGLTFDVITHIQTVSGVCLSLCACVWQLRQTYFKRNCTCYFPALGAISAPLSVSALRKWSHQAAG